MFYAPPRIFVMNSEYIVQNKLYMYCTLYVLQVRHKDEVSQIRVAGHDTLAIIVEEYKVWEWFIYCSVIATSTYVIACTPIKKKRNCG